MITKTQAAARIASLKEQVADIETNILPRIMQLSEQMMEADEDGFAALQEAQNALIDEAGENTCFISGRIAELRSLFDIEEEAT